MRELTVLEPKNQPALAEWLSRLRVHSLSIKCQHIRQALTQVRCDSLKCEFQNEVNGEAPLLAVADLSGVIACSQTESLHLRMLFSVTTVYQVVIEQLVDQFCAQVLRPASHKTGLRQLTLELVSNGCFVCKAKGYFDQFLGDYFSLFNSVTRKEQSLVQYRVAGQQGWCLVNLVLRSQ